MSTQENNSVLDKIEELYNSILDKLFPSRVEARNFTMEKHRKRAVAIKEKAQEAEVERKHKAKVSGRGIFWNKRPYHPAMGANYRKILTMIGIDSSRTVRIYHPRCGTDLCSIAERNGPYIQFYVPPEDNVTEVLNNVAYNQLGHKVERVVDAQAMSQRASFCHLFPIVNTPDMEFKDFCKNIYNETIEEGYVVVSEFVPVEGLEDIIEEHKFVFPYARSLKIMKQQKFAKSFEHDHSDHWEDILSERLEEMRSSVCLETLPLDVDLLQGFSNELKRWIVILKLLEKKKIRVLTRVYKRERF